MSKIDDIIGGINIYDYEEYVQSSTSAGYAPIGIAEYAELATIVESSRHAYPNELLSDALIGYMTGLIRTPEEAHAARANMAPYSLSNTPPHIVDAMKRLAQTANIDKLKLLYQQITGAPSAAETRDDAYTQVMQILNSR